MYVVRREPPKRLEAFGEIVGHQESMKVLLELVVAVIVVPVDGCFLEGPVHALDLSVGRLAA